MFPRRRLRNVVAVPPSTPYRSRGKDVLNALQKVGMQSLVFGRLDDRRPRCVHCAALLASDAAEFLASNSAKLLGAPDAGCRVGVAAVVDDLRHCPSASVAASHTTPEAWRFAHVPNLTRIREDEQNRRNALAH